MKYLLVYNPQAGNGKAADLLPTIRDYLNHQSQLSVDILETEYAGHATEFLKSTDLAGYSGVIASGGDGTLFEVVNGLLKNPVCPQIPIGLIPNGTGNAFMKELGLREDEWQRAIEIIAQGHQRRLDVGELRGETLHHYFLNMVGMGFVSTVAKAAEPLKWLGKAAYTLATLLKLIQLRPQKIQLELAGERIEREGIFVEVANSRFTGTSFLMAPKAQLDDGLLDVVLLNKISRLRLLRLFTSIYDGSHIHYPEVEYFQVSKVKIHEEFPDVIIPDGEMLKAELIEYQIKPRAISFFWPDDGTSCS